MAKQLKNYTKTQTMPDVKNGDIPKDLAAKIDQYEGMNEDALINQLISKVEESKRNGTYNSQEIQGFVNMLSPHLTAAQKTKLSQLISVIENDN